MIKELIEAGKEHSLQLEVYVPSNCNTTYEILNGKLTKYETADVSNYRIKAIKDNYSMVMNTESIDNIKMIIDTLLEQFLLIDNKDQDTLANTVITSNIIDMRHDLSNKKEKLLLLDDIRVKDKDVKDLIIGFTYSKDNHKLVNDIVFLEDEVESYNYSAEVVIVKNHITKSSYVSLSKVDDCYDEFRDLLIEEINNLKMKIDSDSLETNKYNIILKNECVDAILDQFQNMFLEEIIEKKLSPIWDKFNQKIFSDKLTIIEDPTDVTMIGKRNFDSEGTKTFTKEIIKNGVFSKILYNNKYAIKNNTNSTGNSYGVRNLYIKPGIKTIDELLNKHDTCILIDEIEGMHAGINTTTGDISLQAQGFLIKNGKKIKGLNMIIISTNIFELFTNIEEIGSDLRMFSENSGAPSILLNDIMISGNK